MHAWHTCMPGGTHMQTAQACTPLSTLCCCSCSCACIALTLGCGTPPPLSQMAPLTPLRACMAAAASAAARQHDGTAVAPRARWIPRGGQAAPAVYLACFGGVNGKL